MKQEQNTRFECGSLLVSRVANIPAVVLNKSETTQGTSLTTGVSVSTNAGFIYTFTTGTLATLGNVSFQVSAPFVSANSLVNVGINNHGGNGVPQVYVNNVTQGNFSIRVRNLDATNALTGSLKLTYNVQ